MTFCCHHFYCTLYIMLNYSHFRLNNIFLLQVSGACCVINILECRIMPRVLYIRIGTIAERSIKQLSLACHCKLRCCLYKVDYKSLSCRYRIQVLINQLCIHFVHLMCSPIQPTISCCLLPPLPFTVRNNAE
jgi:hypothetical protein